jgi:hypothetical protein
MLTFCDHVLKRQPIAYEVLLLLLDGQIKASEHMISIMADLEALKATVCALDPSAPEILRTNLLSTGTTF